MEHIVVTGNIVRDFNQIVEINPYNEEHLKLLNDYDSKYGTNYRNIALDITSNVKKEEYEIYRMSTPILKTLFALIENNSLNSVCLVEYENDLRDLKMYIDNINVNIYKYVTQHAFKNLGMNEVIIFTDKSNKILINKLLNEDYIPIYDYNDEESIVPFLKEKDEYYDNRSIVCV